MWLKIGLFQFNLETVPSSKKDFVKKFKHIPNCEKYWIELKTAKKRR